MTCDEDFPRDDFICDDSFFWGSHAYHEAKLKAFQERLDRGLGPVNPVSPEPPPPPKYVWSLEEQQKALYPEDQLLEYWEAPDDGYLTEITSGQPVYEPPLDLTEEDPFPLDDPYSFT